MFILFEGDNGTGKTTIGTYLKKCGYFIITDNREVSAMEIKAKEYPSGSQERFDAFLEYNKFVGSHINRAEKVVVIRYWISTVAASFADGLFPLDRALSIANDLYRTMPKPDYIFRLFCDYSVRIARIAERNLTLKNVQDDMSLIRDEKYQTILDILSKKIDGWYTINTTYRTPLQVFEEIKTKVEME